MVHFRGSSAFLCSERWSKWIRDSFTKHFDHCKCYFSLSHLFRSTQNMRFAHLQENRHTFSHSQFQTHDNPKCSQIWRPRIVCNWESSLQGLSWRRQKEKRKSIFTNGNAIESIFQTHHLSFSLSRSILSCIWRQQKLRMHLPNVCAGRGQTVNSIYRIHWINACIAAMWQHCVALFAILNRRRRGIVVCVCECVAGQPAITARHI